MEAEATTEVGRGGISGWSARVAQTIGRLRGQRTALPCLLDRIAGADRLARMLRDGSPRANCVTNNFHTEHFGFRESGLKGAGEAGGEVRPAHRAAQYM
jgi:hypothetical protein